MSLASVFPVVALGTVLLAGPARADPVAVSVGQTKVLRVSAALAEVTVHDAAVASARRFANGVELVGQALGRTSLRLRTVDGDVLDVEVSVVTRGSTVYEMRPRTPGRSQHASESRGGWGAGPATLKLHHDADVPRCGVTPVRHMGDSIAGH